MAGRYAWVPVSKERAIEVLRERRVTGVTEPIVMAANYDSDGDVGEWDGLEVSDLVTYEASLDLYDLMDEWGPFCLVYER